MHHLRAPLHPPASHCTTPTLDGPIHRRLPTRAPSPLGSFVPTGPLDIVYSSPRSCTHSGSAALARRRAFAVDPARNRPAAAPGGARAPNLETPAHTAECTFWRRQGCFTSLYILWDTVIARPALLTIALPRHGGGGPRSPKRARTPGTSPISNCGHMSGSVGLGHVAGIALPAAGGCPFLRRFLPRPANCTGVSLGQVAIHPSAPPSPLEFTPTATGVRRPDPRIPSAHRNQQPT
ncbi:hypothetical protein B0H14DRAFT_3466436 [Mycena olivaceomarginata]|nr:hypothetical protein B0H14DRAFT_3466436 [Mycena olivaceomarginata]